MRFGRKTKHYFKWRIGDVYKSTTWWVQFHHKPKGPLLDKLIEDTHVQI